MSGCVHKQRERNLGHRLVALRTLHRRPVSHVRSRSLSLSRARALCKRLPLSHTHAHSCTHTHTRAGTRAHTHAQATQNRPHRSVGLPRALTVCLSPFFLSTYACTRTRTYPKPPTLPPPLPPSFTHNSPSTNSLPPAYTTHPPPTG